MTTAIIIALTEIFIVDQPLLQLRRSLSSCCPFSFYITQLPVCALTKMTNWPKPHKLGNKAECVDYNYSIH